MVTYLSELLPFLSTATIPSDIGVQNEIDYLNMQMTVNNRNVDILIVSIPKLFKNFKTI